jgi:hypothetical protein
MPFKFFITPSYAPSRRIWCEHDGFNGEPGLFRLMDAYSIWHGRDKSGSNYSSWEIDPKNEAGIREVLLKTGWVEEQFETIPHPYNSFRG